jgi:hypothetical protein
MVFKGAQPALAPRLAESAFAVWCADGPKAGELRKAHLDGHLDYIERHYDRYLVAGPLRRDGEARLAGSLLVIVADTEAEARRFLGGDPYVAEGVFAEMIFRKMTPAAGRWMGGVIWEGPESLRALADGGQ